MKAIVKGNQIHIDNKNYQIGLYAEVSIIPLSGEIRPQRQIPDGEYRVVYEEEIKTGNISIHNRTLGDFTLLIK